MTEFGTVSHFADNATVRFERTIAASIEQVWEAITAPEQLARWLASCEFDPQEGGSVRIEFDEDQVVTGTVTSSEPPFLIEYTWTFTGEPDSIVRFELSRVDGGTRVVLEHRQLPSEQAAGYGAGWHAHLDSLVAVVTGNTAVDWEARFDDVLGHYAGA